jgi:cytochrome c-type biogenesis protein CcmH/NrfF
MMLAVASAPAWAQEEPATSWAYDLTHELMSPFGAVRHSMADCPSASGVVQWVVEQERLGRSRAEVEAELYERFGEVLRATPRAEGFGLAAYVVPVLLAIAGATIVGLFLRYQVGKKELHAEPPAPITAADSEFERIVDEQLRG